MLKLSIAGSADGAIKRLQQYTGTEFALPLQVPVDPKQCRHIEVLMYVYMVVMYACISI